MNLLSELRKIDALSDNTKLKVICNENITIEGNYYGFTSALDNEPEEAEITVVNSVNNGLVGILESEIQSIEVIKE